MGPDGADPAVRIAYPTDLDHIAELFARAFQSDPAFVYLFPDAARRARRLPRFFRLVLGDPGAVVLMTAGGEAATVWKPAAAQAGGGTLDMLRHLVPMVRVFGRATPRAMRVGGAIGEHFPAAPHWYLYIAGCDPAHQGSGHGGAAIRAGLAHAGGAAAYLETAKEANLGLYQRLGFRVTDRWDVPKGGPRFWSMWRDAET